VIANTGATRLTAGMVFDLFDGAAGKGNFTSIAVTPEGLSEIPEAWTRKMKPVKSTMSRTNAAHGSTGETAGWMTNARSGFPLPFGRGEGQGEGSRGKLPSGRAFPLPPNLSMNLRKRRVQNFVAYATKFCRAWFNVPMRDLKSWRLPMNRSAEPCSALRVSVRWQTDSMESGSVPSASSPRRLLFQRAATAYTDDRMRST